MSEKVAGPGLFDHEEGTVLESLSSALPFAGRLKVRAHLAIGAFTANAAMAYELVNEGLPLAEKNYQGRMRRLTSEIVYKSVQNYPELFRPEVILEKSQPAI
jgi:hypothetical protein